MIGELVHALALQFAAIMAAMLLLWRLAVAIRDPSFIDVIWAYGMVFLAVLSVVHHEAPLGPAGWTVFGLCALWGLRLGTHLLLRWRRLGSDPRYEKIVGRAMAKQGWSYARATLVNVFLLQGPLIWLVSLPVQIGVLGDNGAPLSLLTQIGAGIALFGIGFEAIADAQLEAFRKDPAMKGQVMDRGLWRYSRHPNYFGDAVAWWGLWLAAVGAGAPWWTAIGPLFVTFTLTRWSGAPLLEKGLGKTRPGYADYVARTSGFVPLPPKRR